jgi:hypothetical protein
MRTVEAMADEAAKGATAEAWLRAFVERHGGVAGSVHRSVGDELEIVAAWNLPEPVKAVTARIPRGKGMAGLALERNEPISTCNLKTDETGNVRPGARAVDAQAAVALPVRDASGAVCAVVGIAFADERELGRDEIDALLRAAADVPC